MSTNPIPGLAIGRVVIYQEGGVEFVAIITRVVNATTGLVTLHVLDYDLVEPVRIVDRIPMDDATTQQPVSWHWPPRV